MSETHEHVVLYSIAELPEGLEFMDELDLTVVWETDRTGENPDDMRDGDPVDELNQLFRRKVESVVKEKNGRCVRVKRERVSRNTNYAHGTTVMTGEYVVELYGEKK